MLGLDAARHLLSSPVVLVPTMGALHNGHIALLRRAAALSQARGSVVVVAQRLELLEQLRRGGAEVLDSPAEQLAARTIERYLDLKRRLRL